MTTGRRILFGIIALTAVMFASPAVRAVAAPAVGGVRPAQIVAALEAEGFKVSTGTGYWGDPEIDAARAADGLSFHAWFQHCDAEPCHWIEFDRAYPRTGPKVAIINRWIESDMVGADAGDRQTVTAFEQDGKAHLQLEIELEPGRPYDAAASDVRLWLGMLSGLDNFVARSRPAAPHRRPGA